MKNSPTRIFWLSVLSLCLLLIGLWFYPAAWTFRLAVYQFAPEEPGNDRYLEALKHELKNAQSTTERAWMLVWFTANHNFKNIHQSETIIELVSGYGCSKEYVSTVDHLLQTSPKNGEVHRELEDYKASVLSYEADRLREP
jgi:hypothetical protein